VSEALRSAFVAHSAIQIIGPTCKYDRGGKKLLKNRKKGGCSTLKAQLSSGLHYFSANQKRLPEYRAFAMNAGCTPAQLAFAWVLRKGENVHVILRTTSTDHMAEDMGALNVELTDEIVAGVEALINQNTVRGPRYPAPTQVEIDAKEFD